jgi:hypothetical protein
MRLALALSAAALALPAAAYQLDTVIPVPMRAPEQCPHGCAQWSDLAGSFSAASQAAVDALWASSTAQRAAGAACAIPAGLGVPMGAICYCAGTAAARTSAWGVCSEPDVPTPQQVNLQYGASGAELQVAWVTADRGAPLVRAPLVELCPAAGGACLNVSGTARRAPEPQLPSRVLTFAFVPLPAAATAAGARFTYRALPGTAAAAWSREFAVALPAPGAVQTLAVFGDQGLYPYSSVGNLIDDARAGAGGVQGVLHLGDLAYNMGMSNGTRGDGYMYALEPLLSAVPWITVEGNHELEGSPFGSYCPAAENCEGRYLNQTAGYLVAGRASGSNTNRFFSLDVGLVHVVVYNTMNYLGLGADVRAAQLAWLEADLKKASAPAQRRRVPWILVATHVPMYCSAIGQTDVGGDSRKDIEPLLLAAGVDLYMCVMRTGALRRPVGCARAAQSPPPPPPDEQPPTPPLPLTALGTATCTLTRPPGPWAPMAQWRLRPPTSTPGRPCTC